MVLLLSAILLSLADARAEEHDPAIFQIPYFGRSTQLDCTGSPRELWRIDVYGNFSPKMLEIAPGYNPRPCRYKDGKHEHRAKYVSYKLKDPAEVRWDREGNISYTYSMQTHLDNHRIELDPSQGRLRADNAVGARYYPSGALKSVQWGMNCGCGGMYFSAPGSATWHTAKFIRFAENGRVLDVLRCDQGAPQGCPQ